MRTQIFETAVRLFYDRGYDSTTFESIASELGISKSLITYHFKTKLQLACEVFEESRYSCIQAVHRRVAERHPDAPLEVIPAVFDRVNLRQMRQDARVVELFRAASPSAGPRREYGSSLYGIYSPDLSHGRSDPHLSRLVTEACRGAAQSVILSYFDSEPDERMDYVQFEDFRVSIRYLIQQYPPERTENITSSSRAIADGLDIRFLPYFEVE